MVKKPTTNATLKSILNKITEQVRGRVGIEMRPDLYPLEGSVLDTFLMLARSLLTDLTGIKVKYPPRRPVNFTEEGLGFLLFGGGKLWWVKPTLEGEVEMIYTARRNQGKFLGVTNINGFKMGEYEQDHYTLGEVVYTKP